MTQRQNGAVGSLSETFFDQGSTSSNAVIDQQVHWNNIENPIENIFPVCLLSNNDINIGYVNSIDRQQQEACRWSLEEPSSSGTPDTVNHNERKMDHGWSSSLSAFAGPVLNERQYERNSPFAQNLNDNTVSQSLNLNASVVPRVSNSSQITEWHSGSERDLISSGAGPEAEGFLLTCRSGGYNVDDNDSRSGEGHRASCKRKTLEGNVEQSSSSESSSYFHCAESSAGDGVSTSSSVGSSVNLSVPSGQAHPRIGSSQRNFRLRISPSSIQGSITPPIFSTVDMARRSVLSSSQQSLRLPTDHSLHSRSAPVVDNANSRNPNVAVHVPTLPRNMQPFRWNGGSGSRTGSSSSSNVTRDRDVSHEGHQSRSMPRNLLDHPIFVHAPELRTLARNPTNRDVSSGNLSVPGNFASTSRAGSSSGANASSIPTWAPQPNHPPSQYPRRLSGLVRRSLMSSHGSESGDLGNHSLFPSGPSTSPEEMLLASGVANPEYHRPYRRLVSWLDRQEAGFLGIPHSLRNLAATDGRSRLVVPEDVRILDQSAFFGVADIHDRHRDMRLDVDNMSYEELLALEERIGNVNTGLSEEAISSELKRRKYSSLGSRLETEPCSVCQEEYNDGEDLATLECGHDFHADCIKKWLMHKNLCPICKTTGMNK